MGKYCEVLGCGYRRVPRGCPGKPEVASARGEVLSPVRSVEPLPCGPQTWLAQSTSKEHKQALPALVIRVAGRVPRTGCISATGQDDSPQRDFARGVPCWPAPGT